MNWIRTRWIAALKLLMGVAAFVVCVYAFCPLFADKTWLVVVVTFGPLLVAGPIMFIVDALCDLWGRS